MLGPNGDFLLYDRSTGEQLELKTWAHLVITSTWTTNLIFLEDIEKLCLVSNLRSQYQHGVPPGDQNHPGSRISTSYQTCPVISLLLFWGSSLLIWYWGKKK